MTDTPSIAETVQWTLEGPMGIYNAIDLKAQLEQHLQQAGALEIQLAAVDDLDSAGVQLLALARAECLRLDKPLRLLAPSEAVQEVLALYNLLDGFDIHPAAATASEHEVRHG